MPVYKTWCGWCKRQQVSYPKQLKLKMDIVNDSFRTIKAQLETAEVRDMLPSPDQRWYRNKIEYSFGDFKQWDIHNTRAVWFHKQWQFSQIIEIDECLLVSAIWRKLFQHFKALCKNSWLPVYNQVKHTWFFRHLMIREWTNTQQFLVNISVADEQLTGDMRIVREAFQDALKQDSFLQEHVTTFIISQNNGLGDAIYTKDTLQKTLRWDGYIFEMLRLSVHDKDGHAHSDELQESSYRISANSFFQTNTHGAEVLFSTAVSLLGEIRGPLIDLYCGTWTIGISFAALGIWDSLYGIELVPDAIVDALQNAKINKLSNTYFLAWKAEELIHSDLAFIQACEKTECIIVDPPRDGLHKNVIQFLVDLKKKKPYKLLYISCNPVTLARDISLLSSDFKARVIQPVDMFPHTHHIETICLMS
jgi:23S rRNA (uracil1939-C5)-methyltransferase